MTDPAPLGQDSSLIPGDHFAGCLVYLQRRFGPPMLSEPDLSFSEINHAPLIGQHVEGCIVSMLPSVAELARTLRAFTTSVQGGSSRDPFEVDTASLGGRLVCAVLE